MWVRARPTAGRGEDWIRRASGVVRHGPDDPRPDAPRPDDPRPSAYRSITPRNRWNRSQVPLVGGATLQPQAK